MKFQKIKKYAIADGKWFLVTVTLSEKNVAVFSYSKINVMTGKGFQRYIVRVSTKNVTVFTSLTENNRKIISEKIKFVLENS